MKKRNIIGVKLDPEEVKRSVKIKLDPATAKSLFPEKSGKNAYDYIKEFLQSEETYETIMAELNVLIHSSLTKEQKDNCPCNDPNRKEEIKENEKACATQQKQFQFAYFLSSNDYVNTVLNHEVIYKDKEALKELTINYFNCFEVHPSVVYFDVDKLIKYSLNANFKALSKLFEGSETFKYLRGINNSIDTLDETQIENELFEKEDENFIAIQKRFLENKKKYLSEKLRLVELEGGIVNKKKVTSNNLRPNRTDLAYFFYYLSTAKIKIIKNVFPSDAAWKEIGDKFEKSPKNIQKAYNIISSNNKERLKNRKDNNILYVIENMLSQYPNALKLAKDELKLAQLNS